MNPPHPRTGALLTVTGTALALAGPVMLLRAADGRKEIRGELAAQRITFPDDGLPADLMPYAGRTVATGDEARAYARYIKGNLTRTTAGRSYAEITAELHKAGGDDEELTALRQTAFTGESLRASLLSAYQAWQITTLVAGVGTALTGLGTALVATSRALRTPPAHP
ncbi:hypothetical protein [Streptomyces tagetis]|uniref:Uncharacterized protein n=1 Tax=Streptomyces tagetis TaxID=2820809 RepID=A0A940XGN0_9ACTN|nr:hypothetical protein [Streptomyces sp. RG38]MBQ0827092.1 hypothetical protein [Streptomyces sp. RG38]